jgi:hypothetical protein
MCTYVLGCCIMIAIADIISIVNIDGGIFVNNYNYIIIIIIIVSVTKGYSASIYEVLI